MMLTVLALLVTLQRPAPRTPPASQAHPAPRQQPARVSSPTNPLTPFDSTVAAIVMIGDRVGHVRSALGQLRRVAFNGPGDAVGQRADLMRQRCLDLETATREEGRWLCRSCLSPRAHAAVEAYRQRLGPLGALGRQCAESLRPLATSPQPLATDRVRRTVRDLSNRIVLAMRPYEADLQRVRAAFGWTSARVAEPLRP
jgi:hypothetical protein